MAAIFVSQTSLVGVEVFSYVNAYICIDAGHVVSENTLYSVFTHVASIFANLLKQKKAFV